MTDLPNWVIDLVMELQREESVHPELFQMVPGRDYVHYEWCPAAALWFVPDDVKATAVAIAAYRRQTQHDKPTEVPDVVA